MGASEKIWQEGRRSRTGWGFFERKSRGKDGGIIFISLFKNVNLFETRRNICGKEGFVIQGGNIIGGTRNGWGRILEK